MTAPVDQQTGGSLRQGKFRQKYLLKSDRLLEEERFPSGNVTDDAMNMTDVDDIEDEEGQTVVDPSNTTDPELEDERVVTAGNETLVVDEITESLELVTDEEDFGNMTNPTDLGLEDGGMENFTLPENDDLAVDITQNVVVETEFNATEDTKSEEADDFISTNVTDADLPLGNETMVGNIIDSDLETNATELVDFDSGVVVDVDGNMTAGVKGNAVPELYDELEQIEDPHDFLDVNEETIADPDGGLGGLGEGINPFAGDSEDGDFWDKDELDGLVDGIDLDSPTGALGWEDSLSSDGPNDIDSEGHYDIDTPPSGQDLDFGSNTEKVEGNINDGYDYATYDEYTDQLADDETKAKLPGDEWWDEDDAQSFGVPLLLVAVLAVVAVLVFLRRKASSGRSRPRAGYQQIPHNKRY